MIAVIAAASTASHGSASCHSSIGPSTAVASLSVAGHSGARAIRRYPTTQPASSTLPIASYDPLAVR